MCAISVEGTWLQTPTTRHLNPDLSIRPYLRRRGVISEILGLLLMIGAIYALINLVSVRFIVQGPSMEPTFHNDQFLIVSRASYLFGEPQRGDIVVFHFPGNQEEDYIKRLIGQPGDTVEFRAQQVYVNGELLPEPYINEPCSASNCPNEIYALGTDEYFLMGDNRNRSSDSRVFQKRGQPVKREHIVGEVIIRYWPPADWGIVTRTGYPD
ncbi:MAG: signal peptidase I [Anaerolineae bacterium]|nr:signal peptidase I [Anaerolineae bacterium]